MLKPSTGHKTMEIVDEFMGKDHDQGIWRCFRNHWHDWYYGVEGHVLPEMVAGLHGLLMAISVPA